MQLRAKVNIENTTHRVGSRENSLPMIDTAPLRNRVDELVASPGQLPIISKDVYSITSIKSLGILKLDYCESLVFIRADGWTH